VKFKLIKIAALSGRKTAIYSVIVDDENQNLFDRFLNENDEIFHQELLEILRRIRSIAQKEGAREHFFKKAEGNLGDGVEALFDASHKKLRLYCIRYGSVVLILGGGGYKNVRALQDNPKLKQENYLLRSISKRLTKAMKLGDLQWNESFDDFVGKLEFEDFEQ
jgi:hypothetical protein